MKCLACGATLRDGSKFCPKCGATVPLAEVASCIACAKPIKAGARFCVYCGASQTTKPKAVSVPVVETTLTVSPLGEATAHAVDPPKPVVSSGSVESTVQSVPQSAPVHSYQALSSPAKTPPAGITTPSVSTTHRDEAAPEKIPSKRNPMPFWMAAGIAGVTFAGVGAWYWGRTPEAAGINVSGQTTNIPRVVTNVVTVPITQPSPPTNHVETSEQTVASLPAEPTVPPKATELDSRSPTTHSQSVPQGNSSTKSDSAEKYVTLPSTHTKQPPEKLVPTTSSKVETTNAEASPSEAGGTPIAKDPFAKCHKLFGRIDRLICEEKTRFKICQGKWGPRQNAQNTKKKAINPRDFSFFSRHSMLSIRLTNKSVLT